MIDINPFKKMYDEIEFKVQEIRVLPMLHRQEVNYMGWSYDSDDDTIVIESKDYRSRDGVHDTTYLNIPISEINNTVIWFKQKFQKEREIAVKEAYEFRQIEKKRVEQNRIDAKEKTRKKEMAIYRKIKKQIENS